MKLTLTEREREAYISGDTRLAAAIAEHMDTARVLSTLLTHVQEDVEENRSTRHLFEAFDDAQAHLAGVIP
jgi:thiamine phosphate synthase YjbQ (UPF0047 family)